MSFASQPITLTQSLDLSEKCPQCQLPLSQSNFNQQQEVQRLRKDINDLAKDKAILQQKVEILELQLQESKEKQEYFKSHYDQLLTVLNEEQEKSSKLGSNKMEQELELKFLRKENQELKENTNQHQEYLNRKVTIILLNFQVQELTSQKNQYEKEMITLKGQLETSFMELDEVKDQSKKQIQDLQCKLDYSEKEKHFINTKLKEIEVEYEEQISSQRGRAQEEQQRLKKDYEDQLMDIRNLHQKDKQFLEDLIKRNEDKLRKGNRDANNYLEMENKYLRDIKDLNDSFDEYKRQVERHITQLDRDKQVQQMKIEDLEHTILKHKHTIRSNANHHELNTKRLREKLVQSENQLLQKTETLYRANNKISHLKNQIQKLEIQEKKLRNLLLSKENFGQTHMISTNSINRMSTLLPTSSSVLKETSKKKSKKSLDCAKKPKQKTPIHFNDYFENQNFMLTNIMTTYDSTLQQLHANTVTNQQQSSKHATEEPFQDSQCPTRSLTPSNSNPFVSNLHKSCTRSRPHQDSLYFPIANFTGTNTSILNSNQNLMNELSQKEQTTSCEYLQRHTTEPNSTTKMCMKQTPRHFQMPLQQQQHKNPTYRTSNQGGMIKMRQQAEDSEKLKVLKENCNFFACARCQCQFDFENIFEHLELNYCEFNLGQNNNSSQQRQNQISTMVSQILGSTNKESLSLSKKKQRKRESLVFKNSFLQTLNRNGPLSMHQSERKQRMKYVSGGSFDSSHMQVAEEVDILSQYIESSKKNKQDRIQNLISKNSYGSFSEEKQVDKFKRQAQVLQENQSLKENLEKYEKKIKELQVQIEKLTQEKQKLEKENQTEVKFLLQQLINQKEVAHDSKGNQYLVVNKHSHLPNNFTLSLSQSHVSLDKDGKLCIVEDTPGLQFTSKQSSNTSIQNQGLEIFKASKGIDFESIPNQKSQGIEKKCMEQRPVKKKISQMEEKKFQIKDPIENFNDRILNLNLDDPLHSSRIFDDKDTNISMSERMSEKQDYEQIEVHKQSFTPSIQQRKSMTCINQVFQQQYEKQNRSNNESYKQVNFPNQKTAVNELVKKLISSHSVSKEMHSAKSEQKSTHSKKMPNAYMAKIRDRKKWDSGGDKERIVFSVLLYLFTFCFLQAQAGTDQVEYNKYELDGPVKDLMWCGTNNDVILVLTTKGNVYRSKDRGYSWRKLQNQIMKTGTSVADEGQEIGEVNSVMQSPVDDNLVVFIGTKGINWVTEDCGSNIRGLNSGKRIHEFQYHPIERGWALAAAWTDCSEFGDEPCKIYKELYITQDLGQTWQFMHDYVYDFTWGMTKTANDGAFVKMKKERVFITHDPTAQGKVHQRKQRTQWSPVINLYMSDDFYKSKQLLVGGGNSIIKTENYMFIAKSTFNQMVQIYVATILSGFSSFTEIKVPGEPLLSKAFTIMDTSEQTVFLHVMSSQKSPIGNVYISDGSGKFFSPSITNVLKGFEYVDFEKVNSLEGVFLANKYVTERTFAKASKQKKGKNSKQVEFDKSEMAEEKMEKMRKNQNADVADINKKQQKTKKSVEKTGEDIEAKDMDNNIKTYITHNKGGKWELIRAPQEDSAGGKLTSGCLVEEGCSLNLHIYSSNGVFPPPYSQESAIGLIMAVGNVGKSLQRFNADKLNTYLSRDGGLNWQEVKKGPYIYEYGDHGGLIVMAPTDKPTTEVLYTYDEGKTWISQQISDDPIDVTNIIIEPFSISQQFVVYGTYNREDENSRAGGYLVTLDFKDLHEPQCRGAQNPDDADSDFETWTPYDGRHGENQKCFLGQQITYVRRKRDVECYNGEELERQTMRSPCQCSEMDYECDLGYYRTEQGTCMKQDTSEEAVVGGMSQDQVDQCDTFGYYTVSQGYRKIPGDRCEGGIDLNPIVYSCSYSRMILGIISLRSFVTLIILGAIFYYGWPIIEAVIIALPIPDPKEGIDKVKGIFSKAGKDLQNKMSKPGKDAGYTGNFNQAPAALDDDDDEDDEDVGNPINLDKRGDLNYDSDEESHTKELISMNRDRDRTGTAADNVPRLNKPQEVGTMKKGDYMIHVFIEVIRQLKIENEGDTVNPIVEVQVLNEKKYTASKTGISAQSVVQFQEHLFFEPKNLTVDDIEGAKVQIRVNDKGFLKDALIGMFDFDVAYVYFMEDHAMLHKWIALSNPLSTNFDEVTGYLKLSIAVAATGDKQIQIKEDNSPVGDDVVMPAQIKPKYHQLKFRFFYAEKVVVMDMAMIGKGSTDGYIKYDAFKKAMKTPVFTMKNDKIDWFYEFLIPQKSPIMGGKIVMSLWDEDKVNDEIIGSIYFNAKEIIGIKNGLFFWKNVYGSPQGVSGENVDLMNRNPEQASNWKGRILMQTVAEETEKPEITHRPLDEEILKTYQAFCEPKEYEIMCEVGMGVSLPDTKTLGFGSNKYTVKVCIADLELQTDKPQNAEGTYNRWNHRFPVTVYKAPYQDIFDIGRVYIYLMDGKTPICFAKSHIKNFIEPNAQFVWYQMNPDLAIGKVKEDFQGGIISVKLAIHNKSKFGPMDWAKHAAWKKPPPKRPQIKKVRAFIFQCRDLPPADEDGTSDPFIKVWDTSKELQKTDTVEDNLNPIYYDALDLLIESNTASPTDMPPFVFEVWDYDKLGDDFMCRAVIPIAETAYTEKDEIPTPKWHPLKFKKNGPTSGEILVSFSIVDDDFTFKTPLKYVDLNEFVEQAEYTVDLHILGLRDLQSVGIMPVKKAFMTLNLQSLMPPKSDRAIDNLKTQPGPAGPDPTLNVDIKFLIRLPIDPLYCPVLQCMVWDNIYKGFTQPKIGNFSIPIGKFIHIQREERDRNIVLLDGILSELKKIKAGEGIVTYNIQEQKLEVDDEEFRKKQEEEKKEAKKKYEQSMLAQGRDVVSEMREEEVKTGLLEGVEEQKIPRQAGDDDEVGDPDHDVGPTKTMAEQLKQSKTILTRGMKKYSKQKMEEMQQELEKEKREEQTNREKQSEDFARKTGMSAFRNVLETQYQLDTRLNVYRESHIPPENLYMPLGWDPTPEAKIKHYRKFYTDELEKVKEIMPLATPFDQFDIKRGQTRGAQKSLNPFASKKVDDSGSISSEQVVGKFKGIMNVVQKEERIQYESQVMSKLAEFKTLINEVSLKNTQKPYDFDFNNIETKEQKIEFKAALQKMGVGHLDICQKFTTLTYDESLKKLLSNINKCLVRVYVISAFNLASKDIGSESDPYIIVQLGNKIYNESDNYLEDEPNPDFYKAFEFEASFPGCPFLTIKVLDKDLLFGDELIGETKIDLEDRFFSPEWNSLKNKPIEYRPLYHKTSAIAQGTLKCWVDILPQNTTMPLYEIAPKPAEELEIRVCVFDTENLKAFDSDGCNDAFSKVFFNQKVMKETDTHFRNQDGKASWNYRMIFPFTYPQKSKSGYTLTVQTFDRDFFDPNDLIGEGKLDLAIPIEDVVLTKRPITISKNYYESFLKKAVPSLNLTFKDECTFLVDLYGGDLDPKTKKPTSNGKLRLQIDILPKDQAEMNKVGEARQEPNVNPYLPPPVGRISLTLNPWKMFTQMVGPQLRRKIYMYCCAAICCALIVLMFPLVFSNIMADLLNPFN